MAPRGRVLWLTDRGVVLGAAALAVYAWVAPTTFVAGDNAEFAALGVTGGAAHPTGYPAYVMWLRAWSWLPGSPAHTAALATALLGAAAIVAMFHACRAWGARPVAATIAAAVLAGGPIVVRLHSEAEVFAMNDLVAALVLWLAAEAGPLRGVRRGFALGVVAGIGLADHMTCALVAPVGVLGVLRAAREATNHTTAARARALAAAFAGLALGLGCYAYLVVAPDTAASWGSARSLDDVLGFITRREYGGPVAFAARPVELDVGDNLAAFARTVARSWLWVLAPVGVVALGWFTARRAGARVAALAGEPRAGWATLAASWLVAGPLLIARFDVAQHGLGRFVCERFHLLPTVLLAVPIAVALDRGAAWLATQARRPLPVLRPTIVAALAAVLPVIVAARSHAELAAVGSPAVELGVRNMLRALPADAIVVIRPDEVYFGSIYVQDLLGDRPDVVVVSVQMIGRPWYRDRLAARGVAVDLAAMEHAPSAAAELARQLLALGRPLFVDIDESRVLAAYTSYPLGTVFRVLPPGTPQHSIEDILRDNEAALASFDLDYPVPGRDDGYPTAAQLRYLDAWTALAASLHALGRDADADRAAAIARSLAPE